MPFFIYSFFFFPGTKLVTNYLKDNGDVGRTKEHRKSIRQLVIEGKSMITDLKIIIKKTVEI